MLTLTSEYALRALTYLAQNETAWPIPGRQIAEKAAIPRKYLSKVLGDLVRARVLEAFPGVSGGFQFVRSPRQVSLLDVLAPFEPVLANRRPCPFGNEVCDDDDPCAGHERWRAVRESYHRFLQETTVHDVAVRGGESRKQARKKGGRRPRARR